MATQTRRFSNDAKKGVSAPETPVRLEGYNDVLPVKKGDTVVIPQGALIKTVGRRIRAASQTYQIRVHHVFCGSNLPKGHPQHDPSRPVRNPKVVWLGLGGYWSEVDINDVKKIEE